MNDTRNIKEFWEKLEKIYKEKDGNLKDFKKEKLSLEEIIGKIEDDTNFKKFYEIRNPVNRGGAGVLIEIKNLKLNISRALKISRPKGEEAQESIANEIRNLKSLKNRNIITLYDIGEVKIDSSKITFPYFIMDFIRDVKNLETKIEDIMEKDKNNWNIERVMDWIIEVFLNISDAVFYMHSTKTIHFDLKPQNILIDRDNFPILADLGSCKKKTNSDKPTTIYSTIFYAHPDLAEAYFHMSSLNRFEKKISPKDFKYKWDIYAFGKTILHILSILDKHFLDKILYNYKFLYIHLMACRMLDGRNLTDDQISTIRKKQEIKNEEIRSFRETWSILGARDLNNIKYKSFYDIREDFYKLKNREYFYEDIPELDPRHSKKIQSSQGKASPFSRRIKSIIRHPTFQRLKDVPQLSLISNIYPTASHSRFEHSLGVFRNCFLYIDSLINDKYNPLFIQLMDKEYINTILLLGLLHDLGQYPMAHELEEIFPELSHERMTIDFFNNPTKNEMGHTIKEVIENKEYGWEVNIELIKSIIEVEEEQSSIFEEKDIRNTIIKSIIDGPIDADKLDYLLRDSQNCYLKYGESIDIDRLIDNLTLIPFTRKGTKSIILGTYEKGQSAAESLAFSRYLLYQSLYWHHASRSIRVMLKEALKPISGKKYTRPREYNNFINGFKKLIRVNEDIKTVTLSDVLQYLEEKTENESKEIIQMIKDRNYYKRIHTVHYYPEDSSNGDRTDTLWTKLNEASKRNNFQDNLQEKIKECFIRNSTLLDYSQTTSLSKGNKDRVVSMLNKQKTILYDSPKILYGTKDELRFIPEPQRIQRNYDVREEVGERVSDVWNKVYFKLMNIVAKGRLYCHPDIRNTLTAVIGPAELAEILEIVST